MLTCKNHAPRNKRSFEHTDYYVINLNWIYLDSIWWIELKIYKKYQMYQLIIINNVIQNKNNKIQSLKHNVKEKSIDEI